jgi:hypothetical protein
VRALAFLEFQEITALRDCWARNESYSSFPARSRDPKFGLSVEELHMRDFKIDFDWLNVGVVVDKSTCIEVVYLELTAFKCDNQELFIWARLSELRFLFLNLHSKRILLSRAFLCLVCLSYLIVSCFNQVASLAFPSTHAPHSDHEVGVNRVDNEFNWVENGSNEFGVLGSENTAVLLLQRYATFQTIFVVSSLKILADTERFVLGDFSSSGVELAIFQCGEQGALFAS